MADEDRSTHTKCVCYRDASDSANRDRERKTSPLGDMIQGGDKLHFRNGAFMEAIVDPQIANANHVFN